MICSLTTWNLRKPGLADSAAHPQATRRMAARTSPPGENNSLNKRRSRRLPGIEEADQAGKDQPDETLAEKPGHQGQKEQGRPAEARLRLPAQQTI